MSYRGSCLNDPSLVPRPPDRISGKRERKAGVNARVLE